MVGVEFVLPKVPFMVDITSLIGVPVTPDGLLLAQLNEVPPTVEVKFIVENATPPQANCVEGVAVNTGIGFTVKADVVVDCCVQPLLPTFT